MYIRFMKAEYHKSIPGVSKTDQVAHIFRCIHNKDVGCMDRPFD